MGYKGNCAALVSILAIAMVGSGNSKELLAYRWNKPITAQHIFTKGPCDPAANFDWTKPVDYANGTAYFRAEIVKQQPVPQMDMKLQWCAWQKTGSQWYEACGVMKNVPGTKGTVVTWSEKVQDFWYKRDFPVVWDKPRLHDGVALKNGQSKPVYKGHYNGEDPAEWFPFTLNFMTVVVSKGGTFSGWDTYVNGGGTVPGPTLGLENPKGGEAFTVGDRLSIQWTADTAKVKKVVLQISKNNGSTWMNIGPEISLYAGSSMNPLWGNYSWTIPASLKGPAGDVSLVSPACKIRIKNASAADEVVLAKAFTIKAAQASILARQVSSLAGFGIHRANGKLSIRVPGSGSYLVEVSDISGRRILRERVAGNGQMLVSPRTLESGIYVLRIRSLDKTHVKRFLVY